MMARLRDQIRFVSKLTLPKIQNGIRVWLSFYSKYRRKDGRHPGMPISISIEPTTACNLGCPECPSGLKAFTRDTGNLRPENFKNWIDQLASKLTYINFYFQGEPYIHPQFLDLVTYASKKKIYTATSTNGHFLTKSLAKKTIESGLDRLIISIDGTTQEVYSQYRVHGQLEKVIQGTKNIIEAKKEMRSSTPHIIFQFLVVRPNEHQIEDVKKIANELGVDEVRFKTAQVYNYVDGNPLIPENDKYSRYKRNQVGQFEVKNNLDNHCWRMWTGTVITWDGLLVPCCFDKDAQHRFGDLKASTFNEIWNNESYRSFRRSLFHSRKEIDICKNCSEGTKVWA